MDNHTSRSRAEAERLLGLASQLLLNKDFHSSKEFAALAQETEPLLEGSDQIVAIIEVLLAAEKRVNNHPDWYSVLQLPPKTNDVELVKKQYRRLALLLHPDKNKFAFAESAFHLVAEAWGVLSDPGKKGVFDLELGDLGRNFLRVDLQESRKRKEKETQNQDFGGGHFPVRRNTAETAARGGFGGFSMQSRKRGRPKGSFGKGKVRNNGVGCSGGGVGAPVPSKSANFWTACPYCYNLYEYPRMYEGCCLRCVKCKKGFSGEGVGYEPSMVPGKEEYYCCWGMFPMGFSDGDRAGRGRGRRGGGVKGFENWMPGMQSGGMANVGIGGGGRGNVNFKATPKPKAVLVDVPVATPSVNAAASVSSVPMGIPSVNVAASGSPVPVATAGVNAASKGSVTPGSSSGPRKRGRPRKNPLP